MSTLSVGVPADGRDVLLDRLLDRSAHADAGEIWLLALAGCAPPGRGELRHAALGLADDPRSRAAAKAAMARAAVHIRQSPGYVTASENLPGISIAYSAQALAGDAALAVFLREHLSTELRDALAGPWAAVFGSLFAERPARAGDEPTGQGPAGE